MSNESLATVLGEYINGHPCELSRGYCVQLSIVLASYAKFLGGPPRLVHLDMSLANSWLAWLADRGKAPATRRSYRTSLLCIWNYAYENGLTDVPPRIRKVKEPTKYPESWTVPECVQLIQAAAGLSGQFWGSDLHRGPYLASLFLTLYSTGIRLGDALALRLDRIGPAGEIRIVCAKTGREIVRAIAPQALELLPQVGPKDRLLAWPLWGRRECLYREIRQLVAKTFPPGRRGTARWFRRAAATELAAAGGIEAARSFLDHRAASTTVRHYLAPRALGLTVGPPPLPVRL